MLLQEAFTNCGLKLTSFEDEVGAARSTIWGWAAGATRANPHIFDIIAKRGKYLSTVRVSEKNFDWICDTFGIKESLIAERLGITKQALHKQKLQGLPPSRAKEIEKILQSIGRRLVTLARKAS